MRIVLGEIVLAIFLAWLLWPMRLSEIADLLPAFALPLVAESINVSIEQTVDLLQPEQDEKAKRAKDCAAGASLVALFFGLLAVGCVVANRFV